MESAIDLTADVEAIVSSTNNGNMSKKNDVLDLTDSQVEVVPIIDHVQNKPNTSLDAIDISDDEDDESIEQLHRDGPRTLESDTARNISTSDSNQEEIGMENDGNSDSREKKRKLAAEAALRRMKK